jgi:hypothetical protein
VGERMCSRMHSSFWFFVANCEQVFNGLPDFHDHLESFTSFVRALVSFSKTGLGFERHAAPVERRDPTITRPRGRVGSGEETRQGIP